MGGAELSLADRHCESGAPLLEAEEVKQLCERLADWKGGCAQLSKTFLFRDFQSALAFVNRVAAIVEDEGHYPEIRLGWGRADVTARTREAGGLTRNDFIVAAKVDRAYFFKGG
jgi:4a-hydroxytetrahydrobiopterin dehydratase